MGDFSGLNTALSGLLAHRRAIDVTGRNIANVNTEGYSRREVTLTSLGAHIPASLFSRNGTGVNGVDVESVSRIRDEFLETRARTELGNQGSTSRSAQILGRVEGTFPEPSNDGIAAQLAAFWGAWDDAANNPSSIPARTAVLEQANSLASTFHKAASDLIDQHNDVATQLSVKVAEANSTIASIAELNGQIRVATVGGGDPSDLQDQRDVLIDKLTAMVGCAAHPGDDNQVTVTLGGMDIIKADKTETITMTQAGTLPPPLNTLPLNAASLTWTRGGQPVPSIGGEVGALLSGANDVIPRYLHGLDTIAANVVSSVNALHLTGHGLDTINDVNLNFFDPTATTAQSMAVSTDVAGQPSKLALAAAAGGALDATIGHALGAMSASATGPDSVYRSYLGVMGVESQTMQTRATTQDTITTSADTARKSVSGVNLDEEMTQLVASQRAYQASARLMTTIDEMLDTLINRTGIIGR